MTLDHHPCGDCWHAAWEHTQPHGGSCGGATLLLHKWCRCLKYRAATQDELDSVGWFA